MQMKDLIPLYHNHNNANEGPDLRRNELYTMNAYQVISLRIVMRIGELKYLLFTVICGLTWTSIKRGEGVCRVKPQMLHVILFSNY